MKHYFIYILSNTYNTVFYTGVTNNLQRRVFEHKNKLVEGFTKKYNLWKLLYYEEYLDVRDALNREKQVKDYRREKKLVLIQKLNPNFEEIVLYSIPYHFEFPLSFRTAFDAGEISWRSLTPSGSR